jgi:amine acid ABC transporter, permease protein, 3-TM region, His/Glu/Gln/Arg/opine family
MEKTFFWYVQYILKTYGHWFLRGAGVTMLIAVSGTLIGTLIGLLIGSVRTIPIDAKRTPPLQRAALRAANLVLSVYVEVFRGTPMIVQAMVIFYGLMEGLKIDLAPIPAGIFIVSINTGAYMAEIVRGGISAIDKGQTEAAHAIGMSHWQTMFHVILPQAIRNILPATGNEFVINIKDTSVLNVISVTELFYMTKSVKGVIYRTYEPFLIVAAIYFVLTFSTTRILRMLERRIDGPTSYTLATSSTMPESILPGNDSAGKG